MIISYSGIMNKKTDAEVENHLKELLHYKDSRVKKFIAEVLKRRSTGCQISYCIIY